MFRLVLASEVSFPAARPTQSSEYTSHPAPLHQTTTTKHHHNNLFITLHQQMADHLCPRLTFPQAPCFSCLSKSIPSMAPSSEIFMGFPMPPNYVIEAGKRVQQRRSWPKNLNAYSSNDGIFNMSGDSETRAKAIYKLNQLLQLDQPRRDSETLPTQILPPMQAT